ncbi:hypothetical protein Y032_0029g2005 [Ancylostoma ceylanicum]|nr:hypothetical protein Y032_0029g2005 [Ancylostoma ceylanicum]
MLNKDEIDLRLGVAAKKSNKVGRMLTKFCVDQDEIMRIRILKTEEAFSEHLKSMNYCLKEWKLRSEVTWKIAEFSRGSSAPSNSGEFYSRETVAQRESATLCNAVLTKCFRALVT